MIDCHEDWQRSRVQQVEPAFQSGDQVYNQPMQPLDLMALDPADLAPLPEVPESYGPRNAEERRILARVQAALAGEFVALDDSFFSEDEPAASQH